MAGKQPSILLVDDEDSFRYSAARILEKAGFTVASARGYGRALEVLESDAPIDLLVTDVVMPEGIHGFALARMARMRRPKLKVLYLSAYDVPTSEAVGKVLRKPVSDEHLVQEVGLALAS